jgi:hypothetical protein
VKKKEGRWKRGKGSVEQRTKFKAESLKKEIRMVSGYKLQVENSKRERRNSKLKTWAHGHN